MQFQACLLLAPSTLATFDLAVALLQYQVRHPMSLLLSFIWAHGFRYPTRRQPMAATARRTATGWGVARTAIVHSTFASASTSTRELLWIQWQFEWLSMAVQGFENDYVYWLVTLRKQIRCAFTDLLLHLFAPQTKVVDQRSSKALKRLELSSERGE